LHSSSTQEAASAAARVKTKMHFSVFAKMRKSCENHAKIGRFSRNFTKFRFAKIFRFCENFRGNEKRRKCSQKSQNIFTKIFAKTKNSDFRKIFEKTKQGENVRKNLKTFSQKQKHKMKKMSVIFFKKIFLIPKMQCWGARAGAARIRIIWSEPEP
jgi:hypothetical protein